ncbi:SRPBCC family protein [Egicoccus sp. AB-alg2]|uniref:SRPBCC family protein n=1 Tax=Egicoccus sp. AB-alg2 TaxID=3242693 RepID=UPI00359D369B
MVRFSNTVEIARPRGEVFAYLADLEHTPEWNWAITETRKVTPGPVGVGTVYEQSRSVPRRAAETLTVRRFGVGELLELDGTLASLPVHLTYEFRDSGGGTSVVNTVQITATGASRLLAGAAGKRIAAAVGENLAVLKRILEQGRHE